MKYAARILAVAVMMMPLLATAQVHKIVVQVPFEFVVGKQLVPAGKFIVQKTPGNGNFLVIANPDTGTTTYSVISTSESQKADRRVSALVFTKYGDRYFLSGMELGDSQSIYWLPRGKAENELRAQNISHTEEVLLASRK